MQYHKTVREALRNARRIISDYSGTDDNSEWYNSYSQALAALDRIEAMQAAHEFPRMTLDIEVDNIEIDGEAQVAINHMIVCDRG